MLARLRGWRARRAEPPKVSLVKVPPPKAPRTRAVVALLVWLLCVGAALVLALGVLYLVLEVDRSHQATDALLRAADWLDLGLFDRESGLFEFTGDKAPAKEALANWGLAAVIWLILGRLLDRLIRP